MVAAGQSVNPLRHRSHLLHSSHPHPLLSLLHPPTAVLLLHHLLPLTHPLPPLPPLLSLFRPSHQCITHQSTSTPLRTHARWPWGRGGAYWRVRVEPCLCSWMGEWCFFQPVKQKRISPLHFIRLWHFTLILFKPEMYTIWFDFSQTPKYFVSLFVFIFCLHNTRIQFTKILLSWLQFFQAYLKVSLSNAAHCLAHQKYWKWFSKSLTQTDAC